MEKLSLDQNGILAYQKNRPPYLMLDAAEEIIPGVSGKGYKLLPPDTWFFACHFEGDPLMPGLLQIEALSQMGGLILTTLPENKGQVCYLTSAEKLSLKRRVVPGDRFDVEVRVLSFKRGIARCEGTGTVGGGLACKAEFTLIVPSVLEKLHPVKEGRA